MEAPKDCDEIFDVVDQCNRTRTLITDAAEKLRVARLNLEAGIRAKSANALPPALKYLRIASELVSDGIWHDDYDFALALHKNLAEAEYLAGNFENSLTLLKPALSHVSETLSRAELYHIFIVQCTRCAKYAEAIEAGRTALAFLGISWPDGDLAGHARERIALIWENIGNKPILSLVDTRPMNSPKERMAMKVLQSLDAPAYYADQQLFTLFSALKVELSLEHGHAPESCGGYYCLGMVIGRLFGYYRAGYEFGELALRLAEKFGDSAQKCKCSNILANFLSPWVRHIRESESINESGYRHGLQCCEMEFTGYILGHRIMNGLFQGKNLGSLFQQIAENIDFTQKNQNQIQIDAFVGHRLAVANLLGKITDRSSFDFEGISELSYCQKCHEHRTLLSLFQYLALKSQILYLYRRPRQALECSLKAGALPVSPFGMVIVAEHNFYRSLILLDLYPGAAEDVRDAYMEEVESNQRQMKAWAENCPENFAHRYVLVEAEKARVRSAELQAMELYERAVALASQHGFIHNEALADELAARFYLSRKSGKIARSYMEDAVAGYVKWGAFAKVNELEQECSSWFPEITAELKISSDTARRPCTARSDITKKYQDWDFFPILKASQSISGEQVLSRLLENFLRIIAETSGAQKTILVLEKGGELLIEACYSHNTGKMAILSSQPLCESSDLATTLVHYVYKTRQRMMVGDAALEPSLAGDPYVLRQKPKSILGLPIIYRRKVMAVLYLEDNLRTRAFYGKVLKILDLLAGQIAISMENALLYRQLEEEISRRQKMEEKMCDYQDELEKKIQERTQELLKSNEDRLHAEKELLKARSIESLGVLAGGIAHDFNNFLNAIMGNVSLAKEELDKHSEVYEILADAEEACLQSKELTKQLLTFAKGGLPVKKVASVDRLIRSCAKFSLSGAHVSCRFDLASDLWKTEIDESQIGQVIHNLLLNAQQAMPKGGEIKISAENVEVGPEDRLPIPNGKYLKIAIADQGMGILPEHLANIFIPYFSTKPHGSGLGLATAHSIIQKHGGHIVPESRVGVGTTFYIYLPACDRSVEVASTATRDPIPGKGKILLLDDDHNVLKNTSRMIRYLGYECDCAVNGKEAVEKYRTAKDGKVPYQWVMIDLTIVGGMGGKDAIARLLAIDPEVQAIVSSGYSNDPVMAEFRKYGFRGILPKPYSINQLSEVLQNLVQKEVP